MHVEQTSVGEPAGPWIYTGIIFKEPCRPVIGDDPVRSVIGDGAMISVIGDSAVTSLIISA